MSYGAVVFIRRRAAGAASILGDVLLPVEFRAIRWRVLSRKFVTYLIASVKVFKGFA